MPEAEVADEFGHGNRSGVIGVALGLSNRNAVVSGEVLK
jgi:hypothetical protein